MPSNSLMEIQPILLPAIETALKASFEVHDFSYSPALKDMLAYHMGWVSAAENGQHGKRIRPLITLLCTGAFDAPIETALPAAVAIEFLHNFTLIHDDIEDKSRRRHGKPTLWTHWGIAQAINTGDALFTIAQIAMLDLAETTNPSIANQAIKELNLVCLHLTQGQHLDITFESEEDIGIDDYLRMITGKTAALVALSAYLGGLIAQQPQDRLVQLSTFGENLGLAFQIQDDYLGIWGDSETIGKSTVGDIIAKKKTLPIILGLQNCPEFREAWHRENLSAQEINQIVNLLTNSGVQRETQLQVQYYTKKSFDALNQVFSQKNQYTQALFELTEILLSRQF